MTSRSLGGAATHAEGLVEIKKRSSPIKKGKDPMPPPPPSPPPAEEIPEVRPGIICVRDYDATIQKGKAGQGINQQGIFRKQVKTNGKLNDKVYVGFFQILDKKMDKLTWTTVSGRSEPSEHTWATLNKWTILYDYLEDGEDHPPVWWKRNDYPVKEGGPRNQAVREVAPAAE